MLGPPCGVILREHLRSMECDGSWVSASWITERGRECAFPPRGTKCGDASRKRKTSFKQCGVTVHRAGGSSDTRKGEREAGGEWQVNG